MSGRYLGTSMSCNVEVFPLGCIPSDPRCLVTCLPSSETEFQFGSSNRAKKKIPRVLKKGGVENKKKEEN
jgi:hypothetical protein